MTVTSTATAVRPCGCGTDGDKRICVRQHALTAEPCRAQGEQLEGIPGHQAVYICRSCAVSRASSARNPQRVGEKQAAARAQLDLFSLTEPEGQP